MQLRKESLKKSGLPGLEFSTFIDVTIPTVFVYISFSALVHDASYGVTLQRELHSQ